MGLLGFFKGQQQPPTDLIGMFEDLHRWGQRAPLLPAEIGAPRAGGQDELAVAEVLAVEHHLAGLRITIDHLHKQDLDVGGIAHHLAQR